MATAKLATVDYEAWRPALAAFYRKDGCAQSAENVSKFQFPLGVADCRVIDALAEAFQRAPAEQRRAA